MRLVLILLLICSLHSCGSYQHSSQKIKSILAINEAGDTIAVPYKDFERNKYNEYTRFNYNNAWYWNSWRMDFNWQWNPSFFGQPSIYWWGSDLRYTNPSRGYTIPIKPKVRPRTRPQVPRRPKPKTRSYVRTPRGSSYNNPRRIPNTRNNAKPPRQIQSNRNIGRSNPVRSRKNQ